MNDIASALIYEAPALATASFLFAFIPIPFLQCYKTAAKLI